MSTVATEASPSGSVISPEISTESLLFDYPEADVVLRSRDSHEFRVLKLYIVHSSPILGEKVLLSTDPRPQSSTFAIPAEPNVDETVATPPLVVQLPIEGAILFSLLTYIFPVSPVLPSTVEQIMELLSVAQTYKMDVVLAHIRLHISQQEPPFIREETAFSVYSLAQKHGLRAEALQASRCTLSFSSLTIEDLAEEHKLDTMPGSSLYELWKYHQIVRSHLTSDIYKFRQSNALTILGDVSCEELTDGLPLWLYSYINTIGKLRVPALLDLSDFYAVLAEHIQYRSSNAGCTSCPRLPRTKIRAFWDALMAVVHSSIAKAEPDFAFLVERTRSEDRARPTREATSPPKHSYMPNADVILQSSDLVHFRVHKSVLVSSSPFFGDMFSLPQPPSDSAPDELPVVHLPEDAEVLNSLISILYPVTPEMPRPSLNYNILTLLSAAEKYDMDEAQSSIRAEVSRRLQSSSCAQVFGVYAVACRKGLIPEVAMAARLTLGHPLTFESLGDTLELFEGRALHDLADFRLRSLQNFCSNWRSFSDSLNGPSNFWVHCPTANDEDGVHCLPAWLQDCFRLELVMADSVRSDRFAETIPTSVHLCDKYSKALRRHVKERDCHFCMRMHILEGENFCAKMKDIAKRAWNVPTPTL